MKIKFWETEANGDGTIPGKPGAVNTEAGFIFSAPSGGCGMGRCQCSPGHWVTVTSGLEGGSISGVTFKFESRNDLLEFLARFEKEIQGEF